jgi:transposase-like protein
MPDQPEERPRNRRVSNRQERVAAALASGRTVAAAARDCQVNEGTIWEWMKQSGFKDRVAELRQLLTDRTIGRLADLLAGSALDTLVQLLNAESDNLKLETVKTLFEQFIAVTNSVDLKARLEALEAKEPRRSR